MKRPTIADIAERAGVSSPAVSMALRGRSGVSEETRARIVAIAEELGWQPSSAARALTGGPAGAIGLMLKRTHRVHAISQFHLGLISGIEAALSDRSYALTLQLVPDEESEISVLRRWWAEGRVDGVIVTDLLVDDPRIPVLEEPTLPAVVVGGPPGTGGLPAVWSDDAAAVDEAISYLAALGHRRVSRVAGREGLRHTQIRSQAFEAACERLGLEPPTTITTDYSREQAAHATRRLLSAPDRPSAIVYDSDVMAVQGLLVAQEMAVAVPDRLSIIGWDDSLLCQMAQPPVTTMSRDIPEYGYRAVELLFAQLAGEPVDDSPASTYQLTPRGTTAAYREGR